MPRKQYSHHYIYKTTCKVTGRYYIGMHSTSNLEDNYIGSGKRLWLSIRKHGLENHVREILELLPDRKSLAAREMELVNEDLLRDPMCMNLKTGGFGGFCNDEHQLKCSNAGREGFRKKLLEDEEFANQYYETRARVGSNLLKALHEAGKLNRKGRKRRKHTEEEKSKISKSHIGEKNSQYGKTWFHNQEGKNVSVPSDLVDQYVNEGWIKGRDCSNRIYKHAIKYCRCGSELENNTSCCDKCKILSKYAKYKNLYDKLDIDYTDTENAYKEARLKLVEIMEKMTYKEIRKMYNLQQNCIENFLMNDTNK